MNCASALFSDGALLSISGTGGRDFPAFTTQVSAPAHLQINTTAVKRGAPLLVSWTGGERTSKMSIDVAVAVINADSTHESYILCSVADTGSYTIPAALTQLLEPSSSVSYLRLDRDHTAHLEPASASVVIGAYVATSGERDVTYLP